MTFIASVAVRCAGIGPARRFAAATCDPGAAQQRKLREILDRNRDTEYGREHGFAKIESLADYAAAVPVVTYPDIAERMERVARGEKNVMTAEDPVMFARTSGTTGKPKLIPVTQTCQGRDHRDQMRTWLYHAQREHPKMMRGQVLSLVSPAVEGHTEAGIPYGSTTGHIYKNMPRLIRGSYAIPYEVFDIEDYDAKYYALMRLGLAADVTFLCTANPSSIVKLCEVADEQAERLLQDIADGTLRRDLEMPAAIRWVVESRCKRDPTLARRLEAARRRRDGRLLPVDYWPNLALIGCWKGGTVSSYVEGFEDWFAADGQPMVPVRDWGYLSSEARGSIPLSDEGAGGVLTVATNVYEFVDAAEVDRAPDRAQDWQFLGATDLEEGKDYYVFLTTTGGLYRYHIDDVIGVEGRHNETPVIVFRRKGRDITSITGEKVSVDQVIQAVKTAADQTGVRLDNFKAIADAKSATYVFRVEAKSGIPEGKRIPLLDGIDQALSELNLEYAGKRKSQRLNPPVLQVMRPGWSEGDKRAQFKQGKRTFQWKPNVLELRPPDAEPADDAQVQSEVGHDQARR
jgi:hypothetical protein